MDDKTIGHMKKFQEICASRFEVGRRAYGDQFKNIDLYEEMISELADLVNYAFMQYLKVIQMREDYSKLKDKD